MTFKDEFIKYARDCQWMVKDLHLSIALNRNHKGNPQRLVISWRGNNPNIFDVKSSLKHPFYGETTLKRLGLKKDMVMKVIKNPRYHTKVDKSHYEKNRLLDTYKAVNKMVKGKQPILNHKPYPKKKFKTTGERAVFVRIWNKRPHVSEISGTKLKPIDHPQWHFQFGHILGKGLYPHYRLLEENIMLLTVEEHFQQTNQTHKCHEDPKWDIFFSKLAVLKAQYQEEFPTQSKRMQ